MAWAALNEVATYLDQYLRIGDCPDEPNAVNGLEVENGGRIGAIIAAVDAWQLTIDAAVARAPVYEAPPLILVHHGLFWDGNVPVTGRRYKRLKSLIAHDIPLYAAHIPLDVHPDVGNNAVTARLLGLVEQRPFDTYKGVPLGVQGMLAGPTRREDVLAAVNRALGTTGRLLAGGPEMVRSVGVITGAAGSRIGVARAAGLDLYLTGEGVHHTYFDAMELGVNVVYAGHYATETVGVKALATHLAQRFGLPWEFHDHPTGM